MHQHNWIESYSLPTFTRYCTICGLINGAVQESKTMNVTRYEDEVQTTLTPMPKRVFLAGPTVRGHQPHLTSWRFEAIELFKELGFTGELIVPEFTNKTESDKYRYDLPVWEFKGLTLSDVILFWIPRTVELIGLTTNCEFGYWMARNREKMVYGRPDNSYRNNYLDIMWVEDSKRTKTNCDIYNTLPKTVNACLNKLTMLG